MLIKTADDLQQFSYNKPITDYRFSNSNTSLI